jgi:8-oxo-dGTP pyrophosphatase MutT (NUDIX family)
MKIMNKFSKINKINNIEKNTTDNNIIYNGQYLHVVKHKDWEFVSEANKVIILPYFIEEGYILLRHEYIPPFQYYYQDIDNYKGVTNFLTIISGTVDKDESLTNAIRRELYEEAGVVLTNLYDIKIDKSLFESKANISVYHICLLELRFNDYKLTTPPTDGSNSEKLSKTIKVSIGDINELRTYDLITDYMLMKLKNEYKIK